MVDELDRVDRNFSEIDNREYAVADEDSALMDSLLISVVPGIPQRHVVLPALNIIGPACSLNERLGFVVNQVIDR